MILVWLMATAPQRNERRDHTQPTPPHLRSIRVVAPRNIDSATLGVAAGRRSPTRRARSGHPTIHGRGVRAVASDDRTLVTTSNMPGTTSTQEPATALTARRWPGLQPRWRNATAPGNLPVSAPESFNESSRSPPPSGTTKQATNPDQHDHSSPTTTNTRTTTISPQALNQPPSTGQTPLEPII